MPLSIYTETLTRRIFELPVEPRATIFSVDLITREFVFKTQYREADEAGWVMDITETTFDIRSNTNADIRARGIQLVTGLDLMYQYQHLLFPFSLVLKCKEGRTAPTFDSLGVDDKIYLAILMAGSQELIFGFR